MEGLTVDPPISGTIDTASVITEIVADETIMIVPVVSDSTVIVPVVTDPGGSSDRSAASAHDELSLDDVRSDAYSQVLHDDPLQLIIAAMLHLDGLPGQYQQPSVQRAIDLLERSTERIRLLVHTMGVPDRQDTLAVVVQRSAEVLLGGRGVRFDLAGEAVVPLAVGAERAAREILLAALCDLRTRASLTTVVLHLRSTPTSVVISLHDDGGDTLPPTPRRLPVRVADLRARAAEVGGNLDVDLKAGLLTLTLPAHSGGTGPTSA